jgi:hypothetical protein
MNDFDDSMVTTAIGLVRQADLTITFENDETDEVWLMARVCNYSGDDPITAARAAAFKEKTALTISAAMCGPPSNAAKAPLRKKDYRKWQTLRASARRSRLKCSTAFTRSALR